MNRIKSLREENGMTQSQLGKLLNVKDAAISKYESEKVPLTAETILKLADIFSVSTDYLLCYTSTRDSVELPTVEHSNCICNCLSKTGLSYEEISVTLGISTKELFDIYADKAMPSLDTLLKISELCEVSTDYLLGIRKESRKKYPDGVIPFKHSKKISERIQELLSKTEFDRKIAFDMMRSSISMNDEEMHNMIEYGFIPNFDTMIKLSNFFNVSVDYILCLSDEKTENFNSAFSRLSEDNKDIAIGKIKELLKEQRYEVSVAADKKKVVGK